MSKKMGTPKVLWLDKYERQARLVPGLLALMPIAITITALGLRSTSVTSIVASLMSMAGGPILLSNTVRGFGLKAQGKLWAEWGGSPTTIALRLRDESVNDVQRDGWRRALEQVCGCQLPSRRSELAHPKDADQKIDSAVARLRELTRDEKRFMLIQAENRTYGFWRNLYAIRNLGRVVALTGCLAIISLVLTRLAGGLRPTFRAADVLGLLANALAVLVWFTLPSAVRVRAAGDKYAHQLLQGAVSLASDVAGGSPDPAKGNQS